MASLAQGSYEDAKALPENNKTKRIAKMRALSEFIPQNAVDQDGDAFHGSGGIFENFNGYNAVVQKTNYSRSYCDYRCGTTTTTRSLSTSQSNI